MADWMARAAGLLLDTKGSVERRAHFSSSGDLILTEWEVDRDGYWRTLYLGRAGLSKAAAEALRAELNRRANEDFFRREKTEESDG